MATTRNVPAPLIEPEDKQPDEQLSIRLRPEVAQDLRAYAQYAHGSSPNHVISSALKRLFAADKGFRDFREAHPEAGSNTAEVSGSTRRGRPKAKSQTSGV
jgi:hypothetical protein